MRLQRYGNLLCSGFYRLPKFFFDTNWSGFPLICAITFRHTNVTKRDTFSTLALTADSLAIMRRRVLGRGKELNLSVKSFSRWSANWGHCKLKLTINANEVKCWFLRRGENWSTRRKTSRCRVENQQTQPTYDAESGNRTRATLLGGECPHHCAIPGWSLRQLSHC